MKTHNDLWRPLLVATILVALQGCRDQGESIPPMDRPNISSDEELFAHVTLTQPFVAYMLFPGVDSVTSGTLNGSSAHQPLVRVSMNAIAFAALRGDTLPAGSTFPDGSVIFKQIMNGDTTVLYAIMYKETQNPLGGSGWLWAELRPDGTSFYSVINRGQACTGCHGLEGGTMNDHVRTFERRGGSQGIF